MLTWNEFEEVLFDIELTPNNRPLILEEASDNIDEYGLRKKSRYVQKCKETPWTRWTSEYLKTLREQHELKHKSHDIPI